MNIIFPKIKGAKEAYHNMCNNNVKISLFVVIRYFLSSLNLYITNIFKFGLDSELEKYSVHVLIGSTNLISNRIR